jgi:hypothetical protein
MKAEFIKFPKFEEKKEGISRKEAVRELTSKPPQINS